MKTPVTPSLMYSEFFTGNSRKNKMIRKHSFLVLALSAVVLTAPGFAVAQFDFGGGATSNSKPWEEFKLNTKTKLKLDFRNASIDNILTLFQKQSGITIVKDPTLTGGVTLTSAKEVGLSDAFSILNQMLSLKGYDLSKEDKMLVIKKKNQQGRGWSGPQNWPMPSTTDWNQDKPILRVYTIQYANASQLARVLNDVFQSSGNSNPFARMGGFGGMGGPGGGFNRGGGGGNFFQNLASMSGQNQPQIRASSDDFSNSVIVNAQERDQGQVKDLIKQLDKPSEEPQKSKVFRLVYADADEVQSVVQSVLSANVPRGKGGATTGQSQGPGAFFQALRGTVAGAGTCVADSRTNSLVVTATADNLVVIDKVINDLDKNVPVESTTFVFPLANARADTVATLMQQAFGTRQGLNSPGGNRTSNTTGRVNNTGSSNNRTNNRNLNGQTQDQNLVAEMPLEMATPGADSGPLATAVGVAQGFGFQGGNRGFGQSNRNNSQSTYANGRDQNGRLVNTRDLTGQVTAIPDINTNSIIVVTSPENADILRKILDQLDKIPEQVMIETMIVEATLDATTKMGIEWQYSGSLARLTGDKNSTGTGGTDFGNKTASPALQGLRYTLSGSNLSAFMNALQTDQKFQILSTPRIFTSNNVQAQINISQSIPYVLSSRQDTNGNFTYNYAFQDVGIVLTVTPRITSNGYVTMDVTQTANDLQGYTSFNAPIVNQREADTTVSVRDGETIVLGGIIRRTVSSTVNKVPLLGDIPLLGQLFKSTSKENQKTELLVFLTPRIVRDATEARKLKDEQVDRLSPQSQGLMNEGTSTGKKPISAPTKTENPTKTNGGQ